MGNRGSNMAAINNIYQFILQPLKRQNLYFFAALYNLSNLQAKRSLLNSGIDFKEFESITNVPVLINTSFNLRGEPICLLS